MTTEYFTAYLLAGFVLYFLASEILTRKTGNMPKELICILLWPIVFSVGFLYAAFRRR